MLRWFKLQNIRHGLGSIHFGTNKLRLRGYCWTLLLILLLITVSCAVPGRTENPERLLKNAIAGISGTDDFTFQAQTEVLVSGVSLHEKMSFEGVVENHNRMMVRKSPHGKAKRNQGSSAASAKGYTYVRTGGEWVPFHNGQAEGDASFLRWNPLTKIERIHKTEKSVTAERMEAASVNGNTITLHVALKTASLDPAVSRIVQEQNQRMEAMMKSAVAQKDKALRKRLVQAISKAQQDWAELQKGMTSREVFKLQIDRRSGRLRTMRSETKLSYRWQGANKEEVWRADYTFRNHEKGRVIPES